MDCIASYLDAAKKPLAQLLAEKDAEEKRRELALDEWKRDSGGFAGNEHDDDRIRAAFAAAGYSEDDSEANYRPGDLGSSASSSSSFSSSKYAPVQSLDDDEDNSDDDDLLKLIEEDAEDDAARKKRRRARARDRAINDRRATEAYEAAAAAALWGSYFAKVTDHRCTETTRRRNCSCTYYLLINS